MTTQLFQSGGVQTTLILPQIIYLDFDGALTAYNGEVLTIDNVTVEDSGLTVERIRQITASLNKQFAGQNVRFVTDKSDLSDKSDYSTIYIGKTSSFEPYGSFAGLAETVDSGNQIKNDNAFVILDSTSDNAQIISTIAHEAGHLLGTLDHGGEGLDKYKYGYLTIAPGENVSHSRIGASIIDDATRLYVYGTATQPRISGGCFNYITGGSAFVYNGGLMQLATVSGYTNYYEIYYGMVYVSNGGICSNTTLSRYGVLFVSSGGSVCQTYVSRGGELRVLEGGFASATTLCSGGHLWVCSGATAADFYVLTKGQYVSILRGATVTGKMRFLNDAWASVQSGAIIDFAVANMTPADDALLNNWGAINSSEALYTVTVSPGQENGIYLLAEGADNFSNTISVKTDKNTVLGNISLGSTLDTKTATYTLSKSDGKLTFEIVNKALPTISITANSASKIYDGIVFSDSGYTYSGNLLDSDNLVVTVDGSITDVGTTENTVTGYKVLRNDVDVTSDYNFTPPVNGTLTVTRRNITLTSADDTKKYDGTPLTNEMVTISGDGWADGEDGSYTVTGSQTEIGSSANTFSYTLNNGAKASNYNITAKEGTLTVTTISTQPITITVDTLSKTYDGSALEATYSFTQGALLDGDQLIVSLNNTSLTDAGSSTVSVTGYKVMRGNVDVTAGYTFADSVSGSLTVSKRSVTLTSESASKAYDGNPLTNHNVTVSGDVFVSGQSVEYSFTGMQTDVGSSKNSFTYSASAGTNLNNYTISKNEGTLTVTSASTITIKADSASKKYDGTALTESGYTYTGTLVEGDVLTVTINGTLTDVGTAENTVSSYKIMRGDVDVTGNYTFGQSIAGKLTVTKRDVTLNSADDSKEYDGTPLTNHNVTVSGDGFVAGEGYTAAVTGSQTEIGSSANTFSYTLNSGTKAENYNITMQTGTLTVTDNPAPFDLQGTEYGIFWKGTADTYVVEYSNDQFEHVLKLQTAENGVDTFAMPGGTYQWQVRNTDSETWAQSSFSATEKTSPESYVSESNGIGDVFFANADGVWEKTYAAQHLGCGTWSGTKELVELEGRNKITDVFTGSTDANLLVMTDGANGDALFVDDIYSAFPSSQQSRIAQIDEIRAGDGDDIVDMTSQRFAYSGDGLTIRGGDGDDTLWSNLGNNQLFGDAGNDRLVGASGNDVLAGGSGNDSMHGGGGDDIFCFCKGWGKDTVEQMSGGSVTLWFVSGSEDNWDAESMTYTTGANSVKVTGVSEVTLKFGDDGSAQYDDLLAAGAFLDAASYNVFGEKDKGIVAVL